MPWPELTAEDRLLLVCGRIDLDEAQREELAHLSGASLDWDQVLTRAVRHGLASFLYRHLVQEVAGRTAQGAGAWPPEGVGRALETAYQAARLSVLRQQYEAGRLLDALAAAGLEAIPLKGLALRETLYPDPALRPSGDLDLLLRAGTVDQAEALVQGLGYVPNETDHPREWFGRGAYHHPVPYRLPGREVQVELHWDLLDPAGGVCAGLDALWQRAGAGRAAGRPVRWLALEDMLLHLAVHASAVNRFRSGLRHVVDLAELLRRAGAGLDWQALATRSREWGAEGHLALALRVAEELLSVPLPPAAAPSLPPAAAGGRLGGCLAAAACRRVLALAPPGTAAEVTDNLGRFLRPGTPRERLRWLREGLFPAPARMAELYGLEPGSPRLWACYLARPFTLAARHGRLAARVALRRPAAVAASLASADDLRLEEWYGRQ